jgi:HlyD family secretion protein
LARLEPASGLITVGARPGARVEQVLVHEGDDVKAGTVLAILEGHAQAERQLALAQAQKASAERQRSLRREKLALERERYDRLKAARLEAAKRTSEITHQRSQQAKAGEALASDAKSKIELGQAQTQLELAMVRDDLQLKELHADQDLQAKQRALEDKGIAAEPDDEVLDRQIDLARAGVEQTEVRAPSPGRVLEVFAHAGEVSNGPLLSLGDVSAMAAKAEVYQSDVARLGVGDLAEVEVLGKRVSGKVTKVGRVVGRNELRSVDPRALQDLRVVQVTVALDDPTAAANFVHMQVDVTILPRK